MVLNEKLDCPVKSMLHEVKWLNFTNQAMLYKMTFLRKLMMTQCAANTWRLIRDGSQLYHDRNLRSCDIKVAWNPRLARGGRESFVHSSVKVFNQLKLPWDNIGNLKSDAFKKNVKSKIIEQFSNGNV